MYKEKNYLMKYLHFTPWPSERMVTQWMMDEVRFRVRNHEWDLDSLTNPYGRGQAKTKAFFLRYRGKKVLAVFLFIDLCQYPFTFLGSCTAILFADEYFYMSKPIPIDFLFDMNIEWDVSLYEALYKYDQEYPRAGLKPFLERYINHLDCENEPIKKNFILPLLGQYNKGWELLEKSGLYHLLKCLVFCDVSYDIREEGDSKKRKKINNRASMLADDPDSYKNLKEWFGVSQNTLKKLDQMLASLDLSYDEEFENIGWWHVTGFLRKPRTYLTSREFFARLSDIQQYNSSYLDLDRFTPEVLEFFMENHLIHKKPVDYPYPVRRRIIGIAKMDDKEILKILRYLVTLVPEDGLYYMKYLDYCGKNRFYPQGLRPKNIFDALVDAELITGVHDKPHFYHEFVYRVKYDPFYRFLKTDVEIPGCDEYCIRVPAEPSDLYKESYYLNHCVSDYCCKVAAGESYILFLRKKKTPHRPYVTCEVTADRILLQAKSKNNYRPSESAMAYLYKWAEKKKISIASNI